MQSAQTTHKDLSLFSSQEFFNLVDFYLWGEIERDSGKNDLTTNLLLGEGDKRVCAKITIQSNGILAGKTEVEKVFEKFNIEQIWFYNEGERLERGKVLVELVGSAKNILKAERAVLNFLGRLSGIATFTNQCVQKVPKSVLVCPTRKTLWGILDKYACVVGGGGTHRLRAQDAFLAKENHLVLQNWESFSKILKTRASESFGKFCEIEVETEEELWKACELLSFLHTQGVIMFDNFPVEEITCLIPEIRKNYPEILLEASGGITLENIQEYGNTGVDILSLGALTHSAPHFPFSLRLI